MLLHVIDNACVYVQLRVSFGAQCRLALNTFTTRFSAAIMLYVSNVGRTSEERKPMHVDQRTFTNQKDRLGCTALHWSVAGW